MDVVLNLIPFNPIYAAGIDYQAPSKKTVSEFQSVVNAEYHIPCTIRQEKGQEISGACGQLALINSSLQDVEDLCL